MCRWGGDPGSSLPASPHPHGSTLDPRVWLLAEIELIDKSRGKSEYFLWGQPKRRRPHLGSNRPMFFKACFELRLRDPRKLKVVRTSGPERLRLHMTASPGLRAFAILPVKSASVEPRVKAHGSKPTRARSLEWTWILLLPGSNLRT